MTWYNFNRIHENINKTCNRISKSQKTHKPIISADLTACIQTSEEYRLHKNEAVKYVLDTYI